MRTVHRPVSQTKAQTPQPVVSREASEVSREASKEASEASKEVSKATASRVSSTAPVTQVRADRCSKEADSLRVVRCSREADSVATPVVLRY